MSFRLSNIHDYNRFIAIDLGSYRVRTCIYEINAGQLVLRWRSSIRQNRKDFLDGSITDLRWVAETIERSIITASAKLDHIPEDIILTFSPEVTIYDAVTTQYIRADRDSLITMEEVDTMIKKIEYESLVRAREKSKKQFGIIHDDIRLISSTLTAISIDGKKVTNPLGFTGSNIRIRVLNVYAPASEYNIMRSIISSLGKRMISVVPTPLLFSKVIERSEYAMGNNIYLDIGYMHTTIVIESRNEILTFETFPFGTKMLIEMLSLKYSERSYLEVENILCDETTETDHILRDSVVTEFFHYIGDVLLSLLAQEKEKIQISHIFLSGWIFGNKNYKSMFNDTFHTLYHDDLRVLLFTEVSEKKIDTDSTMCHALGILAEELLVTKKDPLIRILRYVLYNYE